MTDAPALDAYGALAEPRTLTIERILAGPAERVWAYLTESALRARWLAAGEMELREGAEFELIWRNDLLTDPPGAKPEGFGAEHRMAGRILAAEPPRRLSFTWGRSDGVEITLSPLGDRTRLTLVHRRLPDDEAALSVSAGWHAHLDVLAARVEGRAPAPFWDEWRRLRADYAARLAG